MVQAERLAGPDARRKEIRMDILAGKVREIATKAGEEGQEKFTLEGKVIAEAAMLKGLDFADVADRLSTYSEQTFVVGFRNINAASLGNVADNRIGRIRNGLDNNPKPARAKHAPSGE